MPVLSLYPMTDCRDGDSHSPNFTYTYRIRKLDYSELQPATLLEPQNSPLTVLTERGNQPR